MNLILKKIYAVLAFLSFFMSLGTVGALECSTISFTQCIIQGTLSLVAVGVFTKLAGGFEPYYMEEYTDTDDMINVTGAEDEQQKIS